MRMITKLITAHNYLFGYKFLTPNADLLEEEIKNNWIISSSVYRNLERTISIDSPIILKESEFYFSKNIEGPAFLFNSCGSSITNCSIMMPSKTNFFKKILKKLIG